LLSPLGTFPKLSSRSVHVLFSYRGNKQTNIQTNAGDFIIPRFRGDNKITDRLSKKPFLIWLLTTPPNFQYAATLPCNLSLLARFADTNVSQGSAVTYARRGGIFKITI